MKKQYSASFKAQVVQEILKEQYTMGQIAAQHEIHPMQLGKWKAIALGGLPGLFGAERQKQAQEKAASEEKIQQLYAEIGRLTTQVAWLKKKSGIQSE
jgi:putative transposase